MAGKDYFQRIQHSAGRMRILIQDLLAFSRLNSGSHTIESTNLRALAIEVIADFAEVAEVKQAMFITDKLGYAPVIVVQFYQVLHHLIDNALKFYSPDRPLLITIKSQFLKGNKTGMPTLLSDQTYCHITFTDTGIGFDPQYSEKIIDIFQRLQIQAQ